jgi:hypothetical protein
MAHTHPAHPFHTADLDRRSNAAAWVLFGLATLLLAGAIIFQGEAPAPIEGAGYAGPATIEDWHGNSARITLAE